MLRLAYIEQGEYALNPACCWFKECFVKPSVPRLKLRGVQVSMLKTVKGVLAEITVGAKGSKIGWYIPGNR